MVERVVMVDNAAFMPVVRERLQEGHTVTIGVRGYSMRPFLEDGRDKVTLRRSDTYNVGDAVLAEVRKDTYVLHRIVSVGDCVTLQGDGNFKSSEQCAEEDILGVVSEYIYPRSVVSADNRWLRFRVRLWRWLRPLRRWLLIAYKILNNKPMHLKK